MQGIEYPHKFLLYSPLNQGLKRMKDALEKDDREEFLLYSPLNQGLKLYFTLKIYLMRMGFYSTVH